LSQSRDVGTGAHDAVHDDGVGERAHQHQDGTSIGA
jgi:hypothetical protein